MGTGWRKWSLGDGSLTLFFTFYLPGEKLLCSGTCFLPWVSASLQPRSTRTESLNSNLLNVNQSISFFPSCYFLKYSSQWHKLTNNASVAPALFRKSANLHCVYTHDYTDTVKFSISKVLVLFPKYLLYYHMILPIALLISNVLGLINGMLPMRQRGNTLEKCTLSAVL